MRLCALQGPKASHRANIKLTRSIRIGYCLSSMTSDVVAVPPSDSVPSPVPPPSGGDLTTSSSPAPPPAPAQPEKKKRDRTFSYVKPLKLPTEDEVQGIDFMNNCAVRSVFAGGAGAVLGVAFGLFMGTMEPAHIPMDGEATKPWKEVLKETARTTRAKCWSYFKGFGAMGLLFSGAECVVEKTRAKHDRWNSAISGCVAGGLMAYNTGPKGIGFGCASFAAFSVAIEHLTDH